MAADYSKIKAMRTPEFTRQLAIHEASHCYCAKATGSIVELVTLVPNGMFAGHCLRRGAARLGFVDESAAGRVEPSTTEEAQSHLGSIVDLCGEIGHPPIGERRVDDAEAIARAMINTIELVAGRVGERVFFPDREPLPAESDFIEAKAFAGVISSSSSSASALVSFAEAEAEALIRAHMGVVKAIADALVKYGTLYSEQIDGIIARAINAELLAREHERRREMRARTERASQFKEMIANG